MKFIKNLFSKNEVESKEEKTQQSVEKKAKKRTMPEVNGKELYRIEKQKRRARAEQERRENEKKIEAERKERLEQIKLEEEQIRLEREAKKANSNNDKVIEKVEKVKKEEVKEEKLDLFGYEVELLKHHMIVDVEILSADNANYYVRVVNNFQEAIMPKNETTTEFAINDTTKVVVYKLYAEEYYVSQKRVEQKLQAEALNEKFENNAVVTGTVVAYEEQFFTVKVEENVNAQVHQSKIDTNFVDESNAHDYLNKELSFLVTNKKINRNRLTIELNRRDLIKKELKEKFEQFQEGDRIVASTFEVNRGGFTFEYEGFAGFVPLSEVSHYFYKNSEQAFKDLEADLTNVEVVIIEKRTKRTPTLICSIKQTQQEPWSFISEHYHVGDELTRPIDQKKDYGLFFEIDAKIKGLLHKNEMSSALIEEFDNVTNGDTVSFIIKEIDLENQRIALTNIQE